MTNDTHFDERELDELGPAIAASLVPVAPPPSVKAAVLAAIRAAAGKTIRSAEGKWYRQRAAGVEVKPLTIDETRGTVTLLMKFAPGAEYPSHAHSGGEQTFVVEGSCRIGDVHLSAGDFHQAPAGSSHGVVVSDGGCTLLLVIDKDDYVAA